MHPKKQTLRPKYQKIFEQMGENIKLDRKRRNLTVIHWLRHSYAIHFLETEIYTHITENSLQKIKSSFNDL
jgi:site-specific recombinase XerD